MALSLDPKDMLPLVQRDTDTRKFDLVVGEKTHSVFIQDFQSHPIRKTLIHMDLLVMTADRPLRGKIPVVPHGPAVGEKLGGRVFQVAYDILVEAIPEHFPSVLDVDITALEAGDVIYVDQVTYPEGVVPLYKARYPVILVKMPRGQAEDEDEDGEETEGEEGEAEGEDSEATPDSE